METRDLGRIHGTQNMNVASFFGAPPERRKPKSKKASDKVKDELAEGAHWSSLVDMIEYQKRITVSPEQCGGRPCIRGLRVRVKDVLAMLSEGVPESEILEDYPYLEGDDIRASLAYAASQSDHPILKTQE